MYMENEIGKLRAGFKADLIVVDGNPLKDISCLENDGAKIPLVMRDGIIFKDANRITSTINNARRGEAKT